MWVSQKLNNSVATNDKGEKDKEAAKMTQSMNTMLYIMPPDLGCGSASPCLPPVTVYWIAQSGVQPGDRLRSHGPVPEDLRR